MGFHSLPGSALSSTVSLMATFQRVYPRGDLPRWLHPVSRSLLTHTSTGGLTLAGSSGSVSRGVTTPFLWVLVCARFGLCPLRLESPVLRKSGDHPAGLQGQIPWGFPVPLSGPPAEKPDVGFQTFTTVRGLLWYYASSCSPFCGLLTWWVWDLILS